MGAVTYEIEDHLSVSQLTSYMNCPSVYFFRYVEGMIKPPSGAMVRGSAFHASVERNYKQKKETHTDLPTDDVLEFFGDQFDIGVKEARLHEDEQPGKYKDEGVRVLREYQQVVSPTVQPAMVEREFRLQFHNREWDFLGYIDLVDVERTLIETKTTRSTPSAPSSSHLLQTIAYHMGYESQESERPAGVRVDYAVATKTPKIVSFPVQVTDSDLQYFTNLVTSVGYAIEQGIWYPNRECRYCSRRGCGYWRECEEMWSGRVKEK